MAQQQQQPASASGGKKKQQKQKQKQKHKQKKPHVPTIPEPARVRLTRAIDEFRNSNDAGISIKFQTNLKTPISETCTLTLLSRVFVLLGSY